MARVYKAFQQNLNRHVAVKVMHGHLAEDDEFVGRFLQEAAAVANLRHPHIVQVFDFDVQDEFYYMVMEFIEGPTLKMEIDKRDEMARPFSLSEIAILLTSLCHAIDYAHQRGIVHRDLKPANIMFTREGQVVLTDFGIIRLMGSSGFTRTGLIAGTPAYMSPEQAQSQPVDGRSDIYALGVILYELATGRQPFVDYQPLEVLKKQAKEPPPLPSELNPDLPPAVETVILKAMAKNPNDRFQRARDMALQMSRAVEMAAEDLFNPPPLTTYSRAIDYPDTSLTTPLQPETAYSPECPYRGLYAFREKDAPFFYGRDEFTEKIVAAAQTQPMVALIGPSGSGKSSLVYAGLLPLLRLEEKWSVITFRPGSRPFDSLAEAVIPHLQPQLTQSRQGLQTGDLAHALQNGKRSLDEIIKQILANQPDDDRLLLVSDQFEEIYTLCDDAESRRRFLDELLNVVDIQQYEENPRFTFLLTLRTDFLSQALTHRTFAEALQNADIKLGPMTRRELGQAVAQPARRQGVIFETGLVARILDDVGDEPGNLPLLEFALTELWDKPENGRLTHEGYQAIGEVEGALARYADREYERLRPEEKQLARRIFIQMVRPGAGTEDTRRLATRDELGEELWQLVQKLADARLVVTSRDPAGNETVEVVHEALIRGWGRLQEWMAEDRTFRSWQERLRAGMRQWQASGQDESGLLRGALLAEAEGWLHERASYLSADEKRYIDASLTMQEKRRIEAENARLQQQRAQVNARYLRILTIFSVALLIAIVAASYLAFTSSRNWQRAVDSAAAAQLSADEAQAAQMTAEASQREAEAASANALEEADARATAQAEAAMQEEIAVEQRDEAVNARATAEAISNELATAVAIAETNEQSAELSALDARASAREAAARELASIASSQIGSDSTLALLLAIEAVNLTSSADQEPPPAAEDALFRTLQASQLIRLLAGHTDWIQDITFSPDGRWLATVSRDREVKLWDAQTGQVLTTLTGHGRPIEAVAFSPDNTLLATAGEDGLIVLWNLETNTIITTLTRQEGPIHDVAFSPDGAFLAAANENDLVVIWNVPSRLVEFDLSGHDDAVASVAYSPDGEELISAGADGRIIIWNLGSGQAVNAIEPERNEAGEPIAIHGLAYSPDGQLFASALANSTAHVWDAGTAEHLFLLSGHALSLQDVVFSADSRLIATASDDGTAKVWDAATGQALYTVSGHTAGVTAVAFHPQANQLATASQDNTAKIWNAVPGLRPLILAGNREPLGSVAFSPDGALVATGSRGNVVRVWDSQTGLVQHLFTDHNQPVTDVAFSPDGRTLATSSEDWNVRFWDLGTKEVRLPLLDHLAPVRSLAFHPDGTRLLTASDDGFLRLWDTTSHQLLTRFGPGGALNQAVFNADGSQIAAGTEDGSVTVWQTDTEELMLTLAAHEGPVNQVAFSPDGARLTSAGEDGTVKVWDLASGTLLRTLSGHAGPVLSVTYNPDGTRLATTSVDGTMKLWDPESGLVVRTFAGHTSSVNEVQFSPDGLRLVTASADRTARINELESIADLFARAQTLVTRPLTAAECTQYLRGAPCLMVDSP